MGFTVTVTETVVSNFYFDTEQEARDAVENGTLWEQTADVIDGEVNDTEIYNDSTRERVL